MAGSAVDDGRVVRVLTIMDDHSPDIDKDEKRDVCELLEWEQERKYVIWKTLCEAIQRMKSVRCERRGHDPFVMGLVQRLVNTLVVQTAMDPVNTGVCEEDEQRELQPVVPDSWAFFCCVVEFGVAADFG